MSALSCAKRASLAPFAGDAQYKGFTGDGDARQWPAPGGRTNNLGVVAAEWSVNARAVAEARPSSRMSVISWYGPRSVVSPAFIPVLTEGWLL